MLIPPTWLAAGGLALAVAGFGAGWQVRDWKADSAALKAALKADAERARLQTIVETQATRYEQERADAAPRNVERQERVRTIYRDRVVPAECAVPDDARRLLTEAIAEADTRASGKSRAAVPDDPGTP